MKILIQAAVISLFAASAAQAQQAVQWKVSDGGNGHWYSLRNFATAVTWHQARSIALSVGGDLVTITSETEQAIIVPLLSQALVPNGGGGVWMGGFQLPGDPEPGGFRWVSGEPFDFTGPFWKPSNCCSSCPGESGENYVTIASGIDCQTYGSPSCSAGNWNDVGCIGSQAAIIEWSADCNNDGIVDYGQILDGTLTDVNGDGIPDVCQAPCVPADLNNDRSVDGADLGVLLSAWGPAGPESARADINGNGIVDGADLGVLLANWGACGEAPPWATVVQWQPDPAVVTDDQLRVAIAATGLPWRVRDAGTQIEMLLVPPGTFQMGCIFESIDWSCFSWELPVHQVTLTNAFYLGRYEVTQEQWLARMGSNPSGFQWPSAQVPIDQVPRRPVEQVSWTLVEGYLSATGLRLPTEAEWEYACRAGTQTPFHNGSTDDDTLGTLAWYWFNSGGQTHPVGGKLANALGFHDMLGNVFEWTNDWLGSYSGAAQTNPSGPASGTYRATRGGCWNDFSLWVRSSSRSYGVAPAPTGDRVGFRVARNP